MLEVIDLALFYNGLNYRLSLCSKCLPFALTCTRGSMVLTYQWCSSSSHNIRSNCFISIWHRCTSLLFWLFFSSSVIVRHLTFLHGSRYICTPVQHSNLVEANMDFSLYNHKDKVRYRVNWLDFHWSEFEHPCSKGMRTVGDGSNFYKPCILSYFNNGRGSMKSTLLQWWAISDQI